MDFSSFGKNGITKKTLIVGGILSLGTIVTTAVVFSRLPNQIPVHWNVNGEVDRYGSRGIAWLFAGLPVLLLVLMSVLPAADPRRNNYSRSAKAYNVTTIGIVSVMAAVDSLVLFSSLGFSIRVDALVKGIVGVLFVMIGNYLGTVKSTFFFGIRTPWTLADDGVWRKTHRLGAWLFVVAGFIFLGTMFVRGLWGFVPALVGIGLAAIVPTVYSYVQYRKLQKD